MIEAHGSFMKGIVFVMSTIVKSRIAGNQNQLLNVLNSRTVLFPTNTGLDNGAQKFGISRQKLKRNAGQGSGNDLLLLAFQAKQLSVQRKDRERFIFISFSTLDSLRGYGRPYPSKVSRCCKNKHTILPTSFPQMEQEKVKREHVS